MSLLLSCAASCSKPQSADNELTADRHATQLHELAELRRTLAQPRFLDCTSATSLPQEAAMCLEVMLGGKLFQFGAPANDWSSLDVIPEAVFLTGHLTADIAGLMSLRQTTWQLGRGGPLIVYGGDHVAQIVDGLEQSQIIGDATATVRSSGRLDFSDAPIIAREISGEANAGWRIVHDTGDVTIFGRMDAGPFGEHVVTYRVEHREISETWIVPCGGAMPAAIGTAPVRVYVAAIDSEEIRSLVEIAGELGLRDHSRRLNDLLDTCRSVDEVRQWASTKGEAVEFVIISGANSLQP